MVKEKGGDKKSGHSDYTLITIDENHAFALKNEGLQERLRTTNILMKEAESIVGGLNEKFLQQQEWQAYLNCDPLPKPHEPGNIRNFFHKMFFLEREEVELSHNWQLAQDERSILTQDIDAVDFTGRNIRQNREEFGEAYAKYVADTIAVIRRIQGFLEKPRVLLSERELRDLEEITRQAYVYIIHFIDSLTSRVLCSETAYMDPIDPTSAQYSFHGADFDIHIWTFLNVPIYLDPVDTPFKIINLMQIKTTLMIPFSVLCENMVIRGTHSKFDNFSPHARYYALPGVDAMEESNLPRCVKNEWEDQMAIQAAVKENLIRIRAEFEEAERLRIEEEEVKARLRKKGDGDKPKQEPESKKRSKKPPREPQIVQPHQVPIVRDEFLKQNQIEYEEQLDKFNPKSFRLLPGEINLRKYQILGGVYQLQSLEKPRVTNFPTLIMTWYTPNVRIELRNPPQLDDTNSDVSKFFEIQFELPDAYCHWGEPIPCLFEDATTIVAHEDSTPNLTQLNAKTPVIINDFNLHELFTKPMMYDFIENTIPLLISSFEFPDDHHEDEEDNGKTKVTLGQPKVSAEERQLQAELAMQQQMLSFEAQSRPERLFPLFKKVLPVVILPQSTQVVSSNGPHPYENFSDFMAALLSIRESYRHSTFRDKYGKPVKIVAEDYDRNIRRPKKDAISSRIMVFEEQGASVPLEKPPSFQMSEDSESRVSELPELEEQPQEDSKHQTKGKTGKGSHRHRPSKRKSRGGEADEAEVVEEDDIDPTTFSKWSTSNVLKSSVRLDQKRVTIWTDRLGVFGFAFNRYQHFPFKSWTLQPSDEDPQEVELAIVTENVMFRFYVSPKGYKVCASDFVKYYKNRKIYLEIMEPWEDLKELKMCLQEKFLNIFPERDAAMYIEGYFSEKHYTAECHTYDCLSLYAKGLKFFSSIWNKLSDRRTMILRFGELRDPEEDMFELKITPEDVQFVHIKELCTELEVISLSYTPTWRNLEWYPDLNHLVLSTFNNALEMRIKDAHTLCYLRNLLRAIRPLSCS